MRRKTKKCKKKEKIPGAIDGADGDSGGGYQDTGRVAFDQALVSGKRPSLIGLTYRIVAEIQFRLLANNLFIRLMTITPGEKKK